jgi:hypothetical protein
VLVNAQADALGLTNLLSAGVQANKAGKPEISTGHQQPTRMGIAAKGQTERVLRRRWGEKKP